MKKSSLGDKFDNKLFQIAAERGHFEKLNCEKKIHGTI